MMIKHLAFCCGMALAATTVHATAFYIPGTDTPITAPTVTWHMELPMKVTFNVVPYSKMRYPTVGDWQFSKTGELKITVAKMSRKEYEDAIGLHEYVEALLCKAAGVNQSAVDAFDKEYEKNRKDGDLSEPGDDPAAPYHPMHVEATKIERMLIAHYGLDWDAYNAEVESMGK